MSDFETKVLQVVNRVLGPDDHAEFYNGTMFVECQDTMAYLVQSEIHQAFRCGIIASKAGTEWAFDFA